MKKYKQVFKASFAQEFAYKTNFVMWRVRNVFQIFLVFFLWDTIFSDPSKQLFGYDRSAILTYVFGLLIVKAFVLSAKATAVAGEISEGKLSFYLLKPINYFKYWLTRDLSSKSLNLVFAAVETTLLYLVLKPPFFLQTNLGFILAFLASIVLAIIIYFVLIFIVSFIPFWWPEVAWGGHFLITVVVIEFLSGALFPLDILPQGLQSVLSYTPFPYLIFFPLQVYLGKISGALLIKGIMVASFWAFFLLFIMKRLWYKGLRVYEGHGQ